ncbi:hypothetical protein CTAYLR_009507 [Chrysophaeum taylorii]|uniref:Uncharacterized protein n=1 Tax=Chrysophaeum taylorii TaxID=2483200 RepID=A0AAD7U4D0_9STRA|nr:hypothetical protein CTAYLR_009507 [Chrysophaeum taylorii]
MQERRRAALRGPTAVKRPKAEDTGGVEHRGLALRLRQLESEGRKGSAAYRDASEKHAEALHRRLRELGCDLSAQELKTLNKPDNEGEIALHKVVYEYFALASGARGQTTLKRMEHCVRKARALCEAGAKVNHKNKYGDSPLLAAAQTDAAEIAKILLEFKADLAVKNRQGYAPLLMAASENRAAVAAVIVPAMAASHKKQALDALSGGYAALHWACINNSPKLVQTLLKHKADKNVRTDPDQQTPLMKAAAYGSAAAVEQLLRARCDATATDADGRTALHHAAKNKATLCVQLLISTGVPTDVVDHHNQKAIFYAAVAKSRSCVTAISAATPNFAATPDAAKVKLLMEGKRIAADDDDDDPMHDANLFGGCFAAAGCF